MTKKAASSSSVASPANAKKKDVKSGNKLKEALAKQKKAGASTSAKNSPKSKPKAGAAVKSPTKRQTKLPVRLIEPKKVDAPQLDIIQTKLPNENLAARVWLYESLIRFDEVETPA